MSSLIESDALHSKMDLADQLTELDYIAHRVLTAKQVDGNSLALDAPSNERIWLQFLHEHENKS